MKNDEIVFPIGTKVKTKDESHSQTGIVIAHQICEDVRGTPFVGNLVRFTYLKSWRPTDLLFGNSELELVEPINNVLTFEKE